LGTAKSVSEYLTDLRAKLNVIHEYAEDHATQEQEKYVAYYNRRAREKKMEIGEQVIVLLPDSSNKFLFIITTMGFFSINVFLFLK